MSRLSSAFSRGVVAFAMAAVGPSAGFAGNQNNQPPAPAPSYPLPSGNVPANPVPYPFSSDPATGELVPNTPTQTSDNWFLTYPDRLDSPASACEYYKSIGAVEDCLADGTFVKPITFEIWKQLVKIDKYATDGKKDDVAHFVNQVDLNLTRNHHMISYWPNQLAGYVCNHSGPDATVADPTRLFPTQAEIDLLVRQIRRHQNLVACVAMEFSPAVEYKGGGQPTGTAFTKFWIFGPEGALLSTVDLDGDGPKGVPQVCTACHGGPFDPAASSSGDLGAHFLPFDIANFAFSSGLTDQEREKAIFAMNLNVYNSEITRTTGYPGQQHPSLGSDSIVQLIKGWYGDVSASNTSPVLDRNFVPPAWKTYAPVAYAGAVAHSCRTCHAAMDSYAFELNPLSASDVTNYVCTGHEMPNSKVTFDRFWLSGQMGVPGQPAVHDNQVLALESLLGIPATCSPP